MFEDNWQWDFVMSQVQICTEAEEKNWLQGCNMNAQILGCDVNNPVVFFKDSTQNGIS